MGVEIRPWTSKIGSGSLTSRRVYEVGERQDPATGMLAFPAKCPLVTGTGGVKVSSAAGAGGRRWAGTTGAGDVCLNGILRRPGLP
jgi:hypothetical protein